MFFRHSKSTSWGYGTCALLLAVSALLARATYGAETDSPLQRYFQWQQQLRCATMNVEAQFQQKDSSKSKIDKRQYWVFMRRDLERDDMQSRGEMLNDEGRPLRGKRYHERYIAQNNTCLGYRTPNGKRTPKSGTFAPDRGDVRADIVGGAALDGYFLGSDGKSLAEILSMSGSRVTIGTRGTIQGEPCREINAGTPYGDIKLWLSEKHGWVPLLVTYTKGPNARWENFKSVSSCKFRNMPMVSWKAVLSDVTLSKVGETYVPSGGKLAMQWTLDGGRTFVQEAIYVRHDFDLSPDFTKDEDAFVFDLPEGSEIKNQMPWGEGKYYEWERGEMVEKERPVISTKNRSLWPEFTQGWNWLDYGMIAFDVALVGIIVRMLFFRRKQSSDSPRKKSKS